MSYSSDKVKAWRQRTKSKMIESMGGKCQCCGYDKCSSALAFHHIDPNGKDLGFGGARANPIAWDKIVSELRKCVLVCHNCHSEIHAGIRELPPEYSKFNESYREWKKIVEYDACPVCSRNKPVQQKFCGQECARKSKRKVNWDQIDLLTMLEEHSIKELESMLGVSNAAIYKQRDRILKNL